MKRLSLTLFIFALTAVVTVAHEPGRDSTTVELEGAKITINYGTPTLGDRNLDQMIVPGKVWRMGMNAATTLETSVALDFGGKLLDPGKYTLLALSDENNNWLLIVSSSGSASDAVVKAPMHFARDDANVDILKMVLGKEGNSTSLSVTWGHYRLHLIFEKAS